MPPQRWQFFYRLSYCNAQQIASRHTVTAVELVVSFSLQFITIVALSATVFLDQQVRPI